MSHLIQLKRRIRSIKTTEKITRAMRLISMSLYTKLDKEQQAVVYHEKTFKKMLFDLKTWCPKWKSPIFFPQDLLNTTPFFIVISSSKGFCGGLNNILFRYIEERLFIEEHQEPTFLTIGKKATDFITEQKLGTIVASYHDLNSNNYSDIARELTKHITEKKPLYSSATVYSSFFKNFFTQRPYKTPLVPLIEEKQTEESVDSIHQHREASVAYTKEQEESMTTEPIWEQDKITIIDSVAKRYLNVHLTTILFQALIAEYAARFVAMDGATTNAEKYLETLTLQFNKLRQALITREVSELSTNL